MNIEKMLADQKKLDEEIFKNAGITEYPLDNMQLALLVELGELANEWRGFKHWSKHKEINREKLLMEFADCLHFSLSLENHLHQQCCDGLGVAKTSNDFIVNLFNDTFKKVCELEDVLDNVISLGLAIGISIDEMESCYYKKHKENYKRQQEGY